jgi:glutaredoxin
MQKVEVIVYSRPGCHLCEDAAALLVRHGLRPREINIEDDQSLLEQYKTCIPVVEIDGVVRFRGRIEPRLLERLLRAKKADLNP